MSNSLPLLAAGAWLLFVAGVSPAQEFTEPAGPDSFFDPQPVAIQDSAAPDLNAALQLYQPSLETMATDELEPSPEASTRSNAGKPTAPGKTHEDGWWNGDLHIVPYGIG